MNKIKQYMKDNKNYIIIMLIGILAYIVQIKYVVLYADDLSLGKIANDGGVVGAFEHLYSNYMNWGGGPTPFIAIIFLLMGINSWKIFSCLIMLYTVIISVRMITYNNSSNNKSIIAALIWCLIYILNIYISRETLYWLDGHLAYVLTAFQFLVYFYALYSRFVMKKNKKYDKVLIPALAFLSGWTGPQTACITVVIGIMFVLWNKIFQKQKINKIIIISIISSIIGFCIQILAPGNKIRMQISFSEFAQYNILEKVAFRLDSVFGIIFDFNRYQFASLPFYIFITLGIIAYISYIFSINEEKKPVKNCIRILSISIISFILIALLQSLNTLNELSMFKDIFKYNNLLIECGNETFNIKMLLPYIISSYILASGCILSFYISIKKKDPLILFLMVCAIISQAVMLISPYSPIRTVYITILILWILISYLIIVSHDEKISIKFIIITVLFIAKPEIGLISIIMYYFLTKFIIKKENKDRTEILITLIILIIFAINNWYIVTINYKNNQKVYYNNIKIIENFVNNKDQSNELILEKSVNQLYGFNGFVGIDWIEQAAKDYFNIRNDVKLIEK